MYWHKIALPQFLHCFWSLFCHCLMETGCLSGPLSPPHALHSLAEAATVQHKCQQGFLVRGSSQPLNTRTFTKVVPGQFCQDRAHHRVTCLESPASWNTTHTNCFLSGAIAACIPFPEALCLKRQPPRAQGPMRLIPFPVLFSKGLWHRDSKASRGDQPEFGVCRVRHPACPAVPAGSPWWRCFWGRKRAAEGERGLPNSLEHLEEGCIIQAGPTKPLKDAPR